MRSIFRNAILFSLFLGALGCATSGLRTSRAAFFEKIAPNCTRTQVEDFLGKPARESAGKCSYGELDASGKLIWGEAFQIGYAGDGRALEISFFGKSIFKHKELCSYCLRSVWYSCTRQAVDAENKSLFDTIELNRKRSDIEKATGNPIIGVDGGFYYGRRRALESQESPFEWGPVFVWYDANGISRYKELFTPHLKIMAGDFSYQTPAFSSWFHSAFATLHR